MQRTSQNDVIFLIHFFLLYSFFKLVRPLPQGPMGDGGRGKSCSRSFGSLKSYIIVSRNMAKITSYRRMKSHEITYSDGEREGQKKGRTQKKPDAAMGIRPDQDL
jgi:hypothetical protein